MVAISLTTINTKQIFIYLATMLTLYNQVTS